MTACISDANSFDVLYKKSGSPAVNHLLQTAFIPKHSCAEHRSFEHREKSYRQIFGIALKFKLAVFLSLFQNFRQPRFVFREKSAYLHSYFFRQSRVIGSQHSAQTNLSALSESLQKLFGVLLDSGLRVGVFGFDLFQNGVESLAVSPRQRDTQIFLARKMIMNTRRFYTDRFGQMLIAESIKSVFLNQILSCVEKSVIGQIFHLLKLKRRTKNFMFSIYEQFNLELFDTPRQFTLNLMKKISKLNRYIVVLNRNIFAYFACIDSVRLCRKIAREQNINSLIKIIKNYNLMDIRLFLPNKISRLFKGMPFANYLLIDRYYNRDLHRDVIQRFLQINLCSLKRN